MKQILRCCLWALALGSLAGCDELLQPPPPPRVDPSVVKPTNKDKTTDEDNSSNTGGSLANSPQFKAFVPAPTTGDNLLTHTYYTCAYSPKHKNPRWVAYEITAERMAKADLPRRSSFHSDPKNPDAAKNTDYSNSGYDRGHLASAEDMSFAEKAMDESFYMSNVTPQDPNFNRGVWKKLEDKVRDWSKEDRRLYIVTGPILPQRITSATKTIGDGIVVPQQFYKVVLDYEAPKRKGIAFIFDNKSDLNGDLKRYAVPIAEIEKRTGIDFFPKLSATEKAELEAKIDLKAWKFD